MRLKSDKFWVEELLAAAMRGEPGPWPSKADRPELIAEAAERVQYHGVAALLVEHEGIRSWPDQLVKAITSQARAQAVWELRHRTLLVPLLGALAEQGVRALLMKGTAVAYDLYDRPVARFRADTDLLVGKDDLETTRSVLAARGFVRQISPYGAAEDLVHQEGWSLRCDDGTNHAIDLHWQTVNAAALRHVLTFDECWPAAVALPRLSPHARTMDRARMLVHACVHRAMHVTAPYYVRHNIYFGANRLIWFHDIHLLASALTEEQWKEFCALAERQDLSASCLAGLTAAERTLGTKIPADVVASLGASQPQGATSAFLGQSRSLPRAWQNFRAIPGIGGKLRYFGSRLLPDPAFVRAKYPAMSAYPLPVLYVRRIAELLRPRRPSS